MPNLKNKSLEEKLEFEKVRKQNISKLTAQFGELKIEYITTLYDNYLESIRKETKINHYLIPFFAYKETRSYLVNELGKSKKP